jgi:hypothetical protein
MQLDQQDRDRCYFHLGYGTGAGIPAQDLAQLEEAMRQIRGQYQLNRIVQMLDQLDKTWDDYLIKENELTTKEITAGDYNRSVVRSASQQQANAFIRANYDQLVEDLAQEMWVPNYRAEKTLRYRFERNGSEYIKAVPGPADTSVGGAMWELLTSGGASGISGF